jgi:hypothetical protein
MARNGSGTYSLPAGNPVVTGTTISSTWANNTLSDIATALTASVANDGQTPILANQDWGNFDITNIDLLDATTVQGDTVAAGDITMSEDFTATGSGKRFLADFSNGTVANRFHFQTSTSNNTTVIGAIPNGSGTTANFIAFNNSNPTNAAFVSMASDNTRSYINTGKTGSGTAQIFQFLAADVPCAQYNTSGVWEFFNDTTFDARVFSPIGVAGKAKNMAASATGTNANVTVTADAVMLEVSGLTYTARTVSLTISLAGSGANGLDTGSSAGSTWYSLWVIYNPTTATVAGLASLSATAPTMPAGYTYKARVGWCRTDGTANKYPLSFVQTGTRVQYKVAAGSNLTALPQLASGAAGNASTPTWVAVGIGNFVPSTAGVIRVLAVGAQVTSALIIVAPNNAYGGATSTTNPPPIMVSSNAGTNCNNALADMVLESTNIYWASANGNSAIACMGWEDNI